MVLINIMRALAKFADAEKSSKRGESRASRMVEDGGRVGHLGSRNGQGRWGLGVRLAFCKFGFKFCENKFCLILISKFIF